MTFEAKAAEALLSQVGSRTCNLPTEVFLLLREFLPAGREPNSSQ
jgi:hypothetical protein